VLTDEHKRSRCSIFANYSGGSASGASKSMDYGQTLWFLPKNPLTQWLRGRKDSLGSLFLGTGQEPITIAEIQEIWRELTIDLLGLDGVDQASPANRCVEMLLRGISLTDMQILTGMSIEQLAPYGQRAKAKAVLEQGLSLDKPK
jgi:hypothetical protein